MFRPQDPHAGTSVHHAFGRTAPDTHGEEWSTADMIGTTDVLLDLETFFREVAQWAAALLGCQVTGKGGIAM